MGQKDGQTVDGYEFLNDFISHSGNASKLQQSFLKQFDKLEIDFFVFHYKHGR